MFAEAQQHGLRLMAGNALMDQNAPDGVRCAGSRLPGVVGNLLPGCEAVVLNPQATPLLARKTAQAASPDELLFSMIVLRDDRLIEKTVISQAV